MSGFVNDHIRWRRSLPDTLQRCIDRDPLDGPVVDVRADVDADERAPRPVVVEAPGDEVARLRLELDWAERTLGS